MSTRSQLTKDLNESVKALLARRVKILLKNVVRLELKGDKTENKVLVFSPCRLFVLAAKVPTRIDFHFHYLEIHAVESKKLNQLCLTVGDKVYSFLTTEEPGSGEVDAMIQALSTAVRQIFPTVPLTHIIRKVDVQPAHRMQHIRDAEMAMRHHTPESRAIGPCGGFSTQYACMCDYHGLSYREEVAWDVDNIYLAHGTRELNLKEFDYLDFKDLVAVISALEANTWFTSLRASNIKLSHDCMERVLNVLRKSLSLQCLYLDNIQVKWDFAHKLSLALIANSNGVLHTLDLSHNLIEDKGGSQLVAPIANCSQGLVHLNLSHCGLTSKGVNQICHSLTLNKTMDSTLSYLNLSDNSLKDDVTNLCNFLAQPNVLKHLDISNTECTLETIFGALLRGCATHLVYLNVSRNLFSTKNSAKPGKQELPLSFKQFFTSALGLKTINIASCKLPLEALKHLLLGLACNESISGVSLDISSNNLSPHGGAHVLESCIHGVRCLSGLDLTDTGIDMDLGSVLNAVSKNKSLRSLSLNRNLVNLKLKHIGSVVTAIVELLQDETCQIQSLSMVDCKLKNEMYNILSALGTNSSLQVMDITGNLIGDGGARLLAKSLQMNTSLHTLHIDRNNISLSGYTELAYGLEYNRTLKVLSYPVHDVMPCMKLNAERTELMLRKIQSILSRNMLKGGSDEEGRGGERVVPSSASMILNNSNYILDQMIVQQKDIVKVVSEDEANTKANEINLALSLIEDAEHAKTLMRRLMGDYVSDSGEASEIHAQYGHVATELTTSIHNYMQTSAEAMIKLAKDQCPTVMSDARISTELAAAAQSRVHTLDADTMRATLVDNAGTVINKKIRDISVSIAAHIVEAVSDKVIEALSKSHKSLLGDSKTRSSTPDVLRSMSRGSDSSRNDSFHFSSRSQSNSSSPIVSIACHPGL
uniref:Leucine-rich repeat-containing protein 16A n=1 Tax=Cacopsylla melanoneura TaxID=428564 RepID=A0A8D9EMM6_9HEMI